MHFLILLIHHMSRANSRKLLNINDLRGPGRRNSLTVNRLRKNSPFRGSHREEEPGPLFGKFLFVIGAFLIDKAFRVSYHAPLSYFSSSWGGDRLLLHALTNMLKLEPWPLSYLVVDSSSIERYDSVVTKRTNLSPVITESLETCSPKTLGNIAKLVTMTRASYCVHCRATTLCRID